LTFFADEFLFFSLAGSHSPSSSLTPQPRPSKINRRNEHGETIVHIVARKGDIKQLKKVLKAGANANEADNAGKTNKQNIFRFSMSLFFAFCRLDTVARR